MHPASVARCALRASLLCFGSLAACATVHRGEGFAEVQRTVAERSSLDVHWNLGTPADREVAAKVRDLLAQELTVDSAVQVALLENRRLQAVYEELGLAQAHLVDAGLLRNPIFEGAVRFAEGGVRPGVEVAVLQPFLDLLYLPLRKRLAATAFAAAKARVSRAVLDFAGEVRRRFYLLQAAQQMLELRQTTLQAAEASHELARRLHAAGNLRDLDLANERALLEQARLDVATAETEVSRARERLNARMGLWREQTQWHATARLPELPGEELATAGVETRAVAQSLELESARLGLEVAGQELGATRTTRLFPEGELGVSGEQEPGEGSWSVGPAVSFPLPLFNQGQGRVAAAIAEFRRREEEHAARAIEIRAGARALAQDLHAARARATYYRDVILPLRHGIVEETQRQYNAMQVGAFQLLQAKKDEVEAGVQFVESLRDYWVARASLDQVLSGGRPPAAWLAADADDVTALERHRGGVER